MPNQYPKRSIQIPLLKAAALALAEREGTSMTFDNIPVTEVRLESLYFWLWPLGARTTLDVWDETRGGAKVLNMNWHGDTIDVLSFRRGDWERVILGKAQKTLN